MVISCSLVSGASVVLAFLFRLFCHFMAAYFRAFGAPFLGVSVYTL